MTTETMHKLTREGFFNISPMCADGAWGTEIQKLGAASGEMCDLWNVEHPDRILRVAASYVEAGAQIILTNTFNSNRTVLAKHGLASRAAELCKAGAAISRQAAGGKAYVFASMGPCGKLVMMGDIDPEEVEESAAEQAAAFEEGGADAIVIETLADLSEAEASLRGSLRGCSLPTGLSFTFDSGADHDRTMMGASIAEVYELAKANGASFVGANCGAGIDTFVHIAEGFAACGGDIPIWVKGNAGKPELDADGRTVFRAGPETYAAAVPLLLKAGARFIGGCCGSTPAHIRAVRQAMDAY